MKKLFTLLTLLLCVASSAWADAVTIGITNTITTTSTEATTETLSGSDNDVTVAKLSLSSNTQALLEYTKGDKAMNDGSSTSVYSTHTYKWNKDTGTSINLSDYPNEYVGFSFTVAPGKTFSISGLNAKLASSANHVFRVVIEKSDGTVLYSSTDKTINRTSDNELNETNITAKDVQNLEEGTYNVKAHLAFNSTGKYFVFTKLQLTGTVGTASTDTRTNVTLSFPEPSYSVNLGETFTVPTLSVDPSAASNEVTYTSSNTNVATVDASTGAVTLGNTAGTTTITASISNSETYKDAEASYTLELIDPNATGYNDNPASVEWPFQDGTTLTAGTITPSDAFLSTSVSYGDMTLGKNTAVTFKNDNTSYTFNTITNNTGSSKSNINVDFVVTPYPGIEFKPTNVYLEAARLGHGNGKITIKAIYGNNTEEVLKAEHEVARNNTEGYTAYTTDNVSVANGVSSSNPFILRIVINKLDNGKADAFRNIKIDGLVNGSPVAVTLYDVITGVTPEGAGTVTQTPEGTNLPEGTTVSFSAAANTGYAFLNRWTVNNEEVEGETYSIQSLSSNTTVTAQFQKLTTVSFVKGAAEQGMAPATVYLPIGTTSFTVPANNSLYVAGKTLTGWNDGNNTYNIGQVISDINADVILTPVFTDNSFSLGELTNDVTVSFPFTQNGGAPVMAAEGSNYPTTMRVAQATVDNAFIDVMMSVDASAGKFNNNQGNLDACQVNATTKITVPAVSGMTLTINKEFTTSYLGETTNTGTVASGSTTWTYIGSEETVTLTIDESNKYPTLMTVVYPKKKTKYFAPTIIVEDFNFENKGYPVTITASEGALQVSTDGTTYSEQPSPYVTYVTATTTYYAKATGTDYPESDVVQQEVTNPYDVTKKYIAWVYESNYKNAPNNYAIASDAIYTGLGAIYNVVTVDIKDYNSAITDAQKAALTGNLQNADLVVISEAAAGGSKAVIALKDIVGNVPVLNMKLFSYTYNSDASKNRWGWGTPKNADKAVVSITPVSKMYKVLNGVTFTDDAIALFAYPNEQNHIQYVDSWQSEPVDNVVLAKTGDKPAMHASTTQKYFGIGLSCDDFTKYNANAVTIIKNAAAMLIAGEDIATIIIPEPSDPEIQGNVVILTTTASMQGWRAFYDASSGYTLDANTKAYVATKVEAQGESDVVVLNEIDAVPAETAVLLKTTNETQEGYSMTLTKASNVPMPDIINKLKRAGAATNTQVYRLGANDDGVGFFAYTKEAAKPDVVVLDVDASSAGARSLTIAFADDEATAIHNVNDSVNLNKVVFDLQGRRVLEPGKGLYIVNGKKVVIK